MIIEHERIVTILNATEDHINSQRDLIKLQESKVKELKEELYAMQTKVFDFASLITELNDMIDEKDEIIQLGLPDDVYKTIRQIIKSRTCHTQGEQAVHDWIASMDTLKGE